jgi:hypothetical protein
MNPTPPNLNTNLDATRALADGEVIGAEASVSAAGVAYESRLRQSVARVMSDVPVPSPALGEHIDRALEADEQLRGKVKTLLHQSIGRENASDSDFRLFRRAQRWLPMTTAAAVLIAAVSVTLWVTSLDSDARFPLSHELGSKLESVYAEAEKTENPSTTSIETALDEAAQIFGQHPMGIDFEDTHAQLLWARPTRTPSGGHGYELGFGVYPTGDSRPTERREVTLVISADSDLSRSQMSDSRLYRILGSDLMVRGWRYGGLTYFMTAESKRAMFSLQNAMRIPETIEASCDWPDSR